MRENSRVIRIRFMIADELVLRKYKKSNIFLASNTGQYYKI